MASDRNALDQYACQLIEIATRIQDMAVAHESRSLCVSQGEEQPLARVAKELLQQRQTRKQFMPPSLFHEPAWEILLSLFIAQEEHRTLNVKDLVQLIDAPATTSQRWIDQLAHMRLIDRSSDPNDRRRMELTLSQQGRAMMAPYLCSLRAAR